MSLLRRRMMKPSAQDDPRKRMEFYDANETIATNVTKVYTTDIPTIACFGVFYWANRGWWFPCIIRTAKRNGYFDWGGRNAMIIKVGNTTEDSGWSTTLTVDGQTFFGAQHPCRFQFSDTYEGCLEEIRLINQKKLPVINEITGKITYEDATINGAVTHITSNKMTEDLIGYYLGVI